MSGRRGFAGALALGMLAAAVPGLAPPARAQTPAAGVAPSAAAGTALAQLRDFLQSTRSARGSFTQRTLRSSGGAAQTMSGVFAFQRPGRLRGGLPDTMEVRDAFGRTSVFVFSGLERNPRLDPELFRFTAPRGADIVEQ